jgi:hypothetical protein
MARPWKGNNWAEGEKIMLEEKQEMSKEEVEKGKKAEEPLPFCSIAPSAEHARALNEDEPCDDSRGQE